MADFAWQRPLIVQAIKIEIIDARTIALAAELFLQPPAYHQNKAATDTVADIVRTGNYRCFLCITPPVTAQKSGPEWMNDGRPVCSQLILTDARGLVDECKGAAMPLTDDLTKMACAMGDKAISRELGADLQRALAAAY